jgi:hypothetical protein
LGLKFQKILKNCIINLIHFRPQTHKGQEADVEVEEDLLQIKAAGAAEDHQGLHHQK